MVSVFLFFVVVVRGEGGGLWGLGSRLQGLGVAGFRVEGVGFYGGVWDLGFGVFRIWGWV